MIIFILMAVFVPVSVAQADSERAYQDYLYQFDVYRQKYNDFKIAKNEYEKFNTLTSRTNAIDKTKVMMTSRDLMLKSYLSMLLFKLEENNGLSPVDIGTYKNILETEVKFLDDHSRLIESVSTIYDATNVSEDLESHYAVLSGVIRQSINIIQIGKLNVLSRELDSLIEYLSALVSRYQGTYPATKQATIDRWMISIKDKKSLFDRNIEQIRQANTDLTGVGEQDLNIKSQKIQEQIVQAKAYLQDASSFMKELTETMQYAE